ncbi:LacI family DNA-binding transcriptional regulator [Streptomyces sp. L7]
MTQGEPPSPSPAAAPPCARWRHWRGVAIKTVSRVVNEVPTVDPAIAARVRDAADKLGYRPNLTASSLRRGTAGRPRSGCSSRTRRTPSRRP